MMAIESKGDAQEVTRHIFKWYMNHSNLVQLGTYLVQEKLYTVEELLHFFEKPWHYEDEWNALADNE